MVHYATLVTDGRRTGWEWRDLSAFEERGSEGGYFASIAPVDLDELGAVSYSQQYRIVRFGWPKDPLPRGGGWWHGGQKFG